MKEFLIVISIFLTIGVIDGCSKKTEDSKRQTQQQDITQGSAASPSAVAGIHWTAPQGWKSQGERAMRAATYAVPSPKDGLEAGECGVFYFGNGQGGTVEDNLNRWISQFEHGGKHEIAKKEVNGLKVTTITISGTYLSPTGPNMVSEGKRENFRLLGAIVEAPQGSVFFKFTGPAQTVDANQAAFEGLTTSVAKN